MPPRLVSNSIAVRPEELAFLRAAVENPGDETPLRILADWLEEHDDPRRAELLRLHLALRAICCEPRRRGRAAQQKRLVELLGQGVQPAVPRQTVTLGDGVAMTFAWIPPGAFLMGSPPREPERHEDEVQHQATITDGFWMAATPVTQVQWRALMGRNPSHFKGGNLPVEKVSWNACQKFCQKLSQRDGQRYRLPSEVEWEYACRAGTTTPFFFGSTIRTEQATYSSVIADHPYHRGRMACPDQTTPVGSSPPNAWGLYDMHGNVWEWCQDSYGSYPGDYLPRQEVLIRDFRVLRGGSWWDAPKWCRSATRLWDEPAHRNDHRGCRMVRCLD